jgi:hypothetical protein
MIVFFSLLYLTSRSLFLSLSLSSFFVRFLLGLDQEFMFDRGFLAMPGWSLNTTWLNEVGLPSKGLLSLEVTAGEGMRQCCCVDAKLRMILTSLVLVNQRDYIAEIARGDLLSEEKMFSYQRGNKNPINMIASLMMRPQHRHNQPQPGHQSNPSSHLHSGVASRAGTRPGTVAAGGISGLNTPLNERREIDDKEANDDDEEEDGSLMIVGEDDQSQTNSTFLSDTNIDFKPLLPLLKLMTQADLLGSLGFDGNHDSQGIAMITSSSATTVNGCGVEMKRFTFDDANHHLTAETDITWSYTSSSQKSESWIMK